MALEPVDHGFIDQGRADHGGDDLVEVGQSLDGIGERRIVDVGFER